MKKLIFLLGLIASLSGFAQTTIDNGMSGLEARTIINNNIKQFNVKDFGAVGDGVTDDTDSIQATFDAALTYARSTGPATESGATVYFPTGEYKILDSISFNSEYTYSYVRDITIKGDGPSSIISCEASRAGLKLRHLSEWKIQDLSIYGDGSTFGSGASNTGVSGAVELYMSNYGTMDNVQIQYHGSNGIIAIDGNWGNAINNSVIIHNDGDGINFVSDNTQDNSGNNGNALSLTNTVCSNNADDGVEWAALGLNIAGGSYELNKGTGIQIGSEATTDDSYGINISGVYFETNDSSQIKFVIGSSPLRQVWGVNVTGCFFTANTSVGDTALIQSEVYDGTYNRTLQYTSIRGNVYSLGGVVDTYISLPESHYTVSVETPRHGFQTYEFEIADGGITYGGVPSGRPAQWEITAGSGITRNMLSHNIIQGYYVTTAVDITADPQIVDGRFDGQEITIWGHSDTYTLTLDDGNGLQLAGGVSCVLGKGDCIKLKFMNTASMGMGDWYEISRSDN